MLSLKEGNIGLFACPRCHNLFLATREEAEVCEIDDDVKEFWAVICPACDNVIEETSIVNVRPEILKALQIKESDLLEH